ncbi:hypothetical protein LOK49_Contig275G00002 [Camellia lanceoleosa]|nr:hypothetical protein LOK49_Contig275G00002 [Camellia lanceoleosa]
MESKNVAVEKWWRSLLKPSKKSFIGQCQKNMKEGNIRGGKRQLECFTRSILRRSASNRSFKEDLRKLEDRFGVETGLRWRKAVEKAGGIAGWDTKVWSSPGGDLWVCSRVCDLWSLESLARVWVVGVWVLQQLRGPEGELARSDVGELATSLNKFLSGVELWQ